MPGKPAEPQRMTCAPLQAHAWYQGSPCLTRQDHHDREHGGRGTLVAAIEDLISGIEGDGPGRSTGEDGRAALELCLAVYESHRRGGARIDLPLAAHDLTVVSR